MAKVIEPSWKIEQVDLEILFLKGKANLT